MKNTAGSTSFQEILYRIISRATGDARAVLANPPQPTRFPVVVKPETRVFLEVQAKALGGSMAGLAGALLDGVAMSQLAASQFQASTITERLYLMIKEHGLSNPAAAEVLKPFGIDAVDLSDQEKLLSKLNVATLERIAEHFHVAYEWLAGKERYPTSFKAHTWYKSQLGAAKSMLQAIEHCQRMRLIILRVSGFDYETAKDDDQYPSDDNTPLFTPILSFEYQIGDNESYTTYQPLDEGRWSYWRCREHIKMVIYFAQEIAKVNRHQLSVIGYDWPRKKYEEFKSGELLGVSCFKNEVGGRWHPDDFVEPWSAVAKDKTEWLSIFSRDEYKRDFEEFQKLLGSTDSFLPRVPILG